MNHALRRALATARLTEVDVAARVGVDPKTVRRWVAGKRPYPRHRWAVADLFGLQEDDLWPEAAGSGRADSRPTVDERLYVHRWTVPRQEWHDLFAYAELEIGVLAYSAFFVADDPGLVEAIRARAHEGVAVRLLLGDPDAEQVRLRGEAEGISASLAAKIRNSLALFAPLQELPSVELRLHGTVLYNSVFFSEKRIFVNHHVHGFGAADAPVSSVNRHTSADFADTYVTSFERTWQQAYHPSR